MKKKYSLLAALLFSAVLSAQNVGIGTATPNASAKLDIVDANRGILLPRVALTSTTVAAPVVAPANWLVVFNTQNINDVTEGMYYWNGTRWVRLSTTNDAWQLRGNAGTNPTNNFVGTTDAQDLVFRTNNTEKMRVLSGGNVGIGTATPTERLELNNGGLQINQDFGIGFATDIPYNGNVVTDAAKMYYDQALGGTNIDFLVIEKTDVNDANPDGGIAFANKGSGNTRNVDMVIRGSGNVGVGTINPATRLHTVGATRLEQNAATLQLVGNAAGHSYIEYYPYSIASGRQGYLGFPSNGSTDFNMFNENAAGAVNFGTVFNGGVPEMTIHPNGNVGIGTTSPAFKTDVSSNTTTTLRVQGQGPDAINAGIVLQANSDNAVRGTGTFLMDVVSGTEWFTGRPYNSGGAGFSDRFVIQRLATGSHTVLAAAERDGGGAATGTANFMTVLNNGNTGFGTNSPIDRLQVANGNARIGEVNPVNGASTYPNTGRALYFSGGQGNSWDSENSDPIVLQRHNVASDQTDLQIIIGDNASANNDRLTIGNYASGQRIALSASGHVGINTLSPAANLDIIGNMKLTDGTQGAYRKLTSDAAGVARWEAAPSDVVANDVSLALISGTATNLYTANQVLAKGTYLVYFYNCIAASSTNYYISAGPELLSGSATINQPFIWEWNQNKYYTTVPSVLKIQSATATVRGRVRHETGGTVTENPASCSGFHFVRIGD